MLLSKLYPLVFVLCYFWEVSVLEYAGLAHDKAILLSFIFLIIGSAIGFIPTRVYAHSQKNPLAPKEYKKNCLILTAAVCFAAVLIDTLIRYFIHGFFMIDMALFAAIVSGRFSFDVGKTYLTNKNLLLP